MLHPSAVAHAANLPAAPCLGRVRVPRRGRAETYPPGHHRRPARIGRAGRLQEHRFRKPPSARIAPPAPARPPPSSLPYRPVPTSIRLPGRRALRGRRRRVAALRRRAGKARRGAFPAPISAPGGESRPLEPPFCSRLLVVAHRRRRRFRSPADRPSPGRRPGFLPPRSSTSRGPHDLSIRVAAASGASAFMRPCEPDGETGPSDGLGAIRRAFVQAPLTSSSQRGGSANTRNEIARAHRPRPQALASRGLSRFVERGRA